MKLYLTIMFALGITMLNAQTSIELGDSNEFKQFISDQVSLSAKPLAFDKNNVAHFCYWKINKTTQIEEVVVIKKTGNGWQQLGDLTPFCSTPLGSNTIVHATIEFDRNDTLHIAFIANSKLNVLKFNGTNWVFKGTPQNIYNGYASPVQLKFNKFNTAYLACSYGIVGASDIVVYEFTSNDWVKIHDVGYLRHIIYPYGNYSLNTSPNDSGVYLSGTIPSLPGQGSASVLRYRPGLSKWDTVGNSPAYLELDSNNGTTYTQLIFDSNGQLYFAAKNWNNIYKLYKLNGNTWSYLYDAPYSSEAPVLNKSDSFYVLGRYFTGDDWYGRVYAYRAGQWDSVGNSHLVAKSSSGSGVLTFDKNNLPYITYLPWSKKVQLLRLSGNIWQEAGGSVSGKVGLSAGTVDQTMIAVDKQSGIPYVIYRDATSGNKATVKRFNSNNNSWVNAGSNGFSAGDINFTKLYIDTTGSPYAVFQDNGNAGKATMMKFDTTSGGSWKNVGNAGLSVGASSFTTMSVDYTGSPFIAYSDGGISDKATVKKYNGSSWINVGDSAISAGAATYTSMIVDKSGTPYVTYVDQTIGNKAVVKRFNGTTWVSAGSGGISPGEVAYTSIVRDEKKKVLYLLYTSKSSGKLTVKQYNDTIWSDVGAAEFTDSIGGGGSIGLDRSRGSIYVIFAHLQKDNKASIMKFDGVSWGYFGPPGFSAGEVTSPTLDFDKDGNVFVAYASSQAFARKFINLSTGIYQAQFVKSHAGKVYPNPSAGELHIDINFTDIGKKFTIHHINGQLKFEGRLDAEKNVINTQELHSGLYILRIEGSAKVYKLIIN